MGHRNWLGHSPILGDMSYVVVFAAELSNSSSEGDYNINDPFRHFAYFFVFNSFDDTIHFNY
jgi:hypothetical protein